MRLTWTQSDGSSSHTGSNSPVARCKRRRHDRIERRTLGDLATCEADSDGSRDRQDLRFMPFIKCKTGIEA
jgi:hypothetical protein